MGNLGTYLWLTKAAKKFGGPVLFLIVVGLVSIGLEKAIAAIVKAIKKGMKNPDAEPVYTVNQDAVNEDGVRLSTGDQFRVLMRDGGFALVERIKDDDHHIMPVSFISGISNYNLS